MLKIPLEKSAASKQSRSLGLEQSGERFLRVLRDDKPFLTRAAFFLFVFRFFGILYYYHTLG